MQQILGYMRKAITDYDMLQNGDRVTVGVSGGKDSVALLTGLCRLREFIGIRFDVVAVTIDPCFQRVQNDFSEITALCERFQIPHIVRRSDLGQIIFEERRESHPCSLCARMRRGILHDIAKEQSCNKIALGHHYNDAVETFVMNLLYEGRIGCFQPVSYLSRKDLTMFRPLLLAPEKEIERAVRRCGLPIVKSKCPVDGATSREKTKRWLLFMERSYPGLTKKIFGAMQRGHISGF